MFCGEVQVNPTTRLLPTLTLRAVGVQTGRLQQVKLQGSGAGPLDRVAFSGGGTGG